MAKHIITVLLILVVSTPMGFFAGCESDAQKGAGVGAAAGAGIGALAGKKGKKTESALIGGAVGAGAGYILGNESDKKKQKKEVNELREEMNTVIVNITNSNGSVSQVTLRKQGIGYVGPRNEFYDHLPTETELKPVYGF